MPAPAAGPLAGVVPAVPRAQPRAGALASGSPSRARVAELPPAPGAAPGDRSSGNRLRWLQHKGSRAAGSGGPGCARGLVAGLTHPAAGAPAGERAGGFARLGRKAPSAPPFFCAAHAFAGTVLHGPPNAPVSVGSLAAADVMSGAVRALRSP